MIMMSRMMVVVCTLLISGCLSSQFSDVPIELIYQMIADYSEWDDRCHLAGVSRTMRRISNLVDHNSRYSNQKHTLNGSPFLLFGFMRCSEENQIKCVNQARIGDRKVCILTEKQDFNVIGVPVSKDPGYTPIVKRGRSIDFDEDIKEVSSAGHFNWACITDTSDRKWTVNLDNNAKLDLSEFDNVEFVSDSLMVGHSVTNDDTHVFKLLSVDSHNSNGFSIIGELKINRIITDGQPCDLIFKPIDLRFADKEENNDQMTKVKIAMCTFIENNDNGYWHFRLLIFELNNDEPISDVTSNFILSKDDIDNNNGGHFMITPDGCSLYGCIHKDGILEFMAIGMNDGKLHTYTMLHERVKEWSFSPDLKHLIIRGRMNGDRKSTFVLYKVPELFIVGLTLPMHRPLGMVGWYTSEIFAMECDIYGTGMSTVTSVSVRNPSVVLRHMPIEMEDLIAHDPFVPRSLILEGDCLTEIEWEPSFETDGPPPEKKQRRSDSN